MPYESIGPTRDEIAVGAYHVWERESRPLGRQKENWIEAQTQLMPAHQGPGVPSIGEKGIFPRNNGGVTVQTASLMPRRGKRRKLRQPRVLVVDDEPPATQMLGGLLRRAGYTTAEENDSTKALRMAGRFKPDIVLLDMHMPWKDGHQVQADFASNKFQCKVPIIFITHDASDRNKSTDSIPILVKPFYVEDLFACLGEAITKPV